MTDSLTILEWDSSFFQRCVGSLSLSSLSRLEDELDFAREQGCDLVYIYSEEELKQNTAGKFILVDVGGQIKFVKSIGVPFEYGKLNTNIVQHSHCGPSRDIVELAYLSGQLSRFRIDPLLPIGSFEELYKTWIAKLVGQASTASIHAYYNNNSAIGMITSELIDDTCIIGLLAVQSSYRGLGIGTELIKNVERLCVDKSVYNLEVKTQMSNKIAQRLYIKNCFEEAHRTFLYHAHIIPGK